MGHAGRASCEANPDAFYHNPRRTGETVFVDDGRRQAAIGTYYRDCGVLHKVATDAQLLRKPQGVAIQLSALTKLKALGCVKVTVWLSDQLRQIEAPFAAFERYGELIDRGFGKQVVLRETRWTETNSAQIQPTLF